MEQGWIKIWRKLALSERWLAEPFTRGQAWVDMLMLANHRPNHIRKRGILIEIGRGELGWSEEALARRWKWSRGKVRRFLSELSSKTVQQIEQQKDNITTRIKIVNYDEYQINGTANEPASSTANGHQTDTKRYRNKNVKNEKKKEWPKRYGMGEYENVYLSEEELKSLEDWYGVKETASAIQEMSRWLESKGKRYKNYKAALGNWISRRIKDGK